MFHIPIPSLYSTMISNCIRSLHIDGSLSLPSIHHIRCFMAPARFLLSDEVLCVARRALSSESGGVVAIISIGIELHQAIHLHHLMACGIPIIWQTTYHGPAAQLAQPFDEANTRYCTLQYATIQ